MPADVTVWTPKVEKRAHPPGERGVVSSLEEVCKRVKLGAESPKVRMWVIECLDRARNERGLKMNTEKQRAEVLLKACQAKLWVPDPLGTEYMAGAHLLTCDPKKDGVCFRGGDCDDLTVMLGACFLSAGLYTCVVGHGYNRQKNIQHVLTSVFANGRWYYADPSTDLPLGECVEFSRERIYSVPNIQMLCDKDVCFRSPRDFNPQQNRFVARGDFVGVDGLPDFAWIVPSAETHDGNILGSVGTTGSDLIPANVQSTLRENPITELMLEKDFCVTRSCLREYAMTGARVGGAAAGAAACSAFGVTAAAAPLCSAIGAWLGEVFGEAVISIGKKFRGARGKTLEQQDYDGYVKYLDSDGPELAAERLMAVIAYGTERQAAVDTIAERTAAFPSTVSSLFSDAGAPTLEQAADFLGWWWDEFPDQALSSMPRGKFNYLEEPAKDHPLWAEWKIASQIYPHGVSTLKLRTVYDLLHPPMIGRDPKTIGYVEQWQESLRRSFEDVRNRSAQSGFIDFSNNGGWLTPRLRESSRSSRKKKSSSWGWILVAAAAGGAAWWLL